LPQQSVQTSFHSSELIADSSLLLLVGVVGPDGIEPSTSPLSGVRSSHLSYGPRCVLHCRPYSGGAGRVRTGDLLSANQALSQLSYSPFLGPRPFSKRRGLRVSIEASWIQGSGTSSPQPLSDSLPYALSGDPVACSPSVLRFNPKNQWRFMEWNDCPLLAHAVHSSASGFQKLHPRSLLERR
jgi:hypothetical protein